MKEISEDKCGEKKMFTGHFFQTFTHLLMHGATATVYARYAFIKREARICEKKKNCEKNCEKSDVSFLLSPLGVFECFVVKVCVFIERTTMIICDHLNPCHENED